MAEGIGPRPFSLIEIGEPIVNEEITIDGSWHTVNFSIDPTALYYITFARSGANNFTGVSKIVAGNILNASSGTNSIYFLYTVNNLSDLSNRVMIGKSGTNLGYYIYPGVFGSDTIKLVIYRIA